MRRTRRIGVPASLLAVALVCTACDGGSTLTAVTRPAGSASAGVSQDSATPGPTASSPDPGTTSAAPTSGSAGPTDGPATSAPATDPPTEPPTPTASSGVGSAARATLVFTGEVLMHQSLIDTALHNAGGRQYDFTPMFDEISGLISSADLAVCHLELPVIPDGEGMEPRYATPPQVIDALASSGFDRCSTASNHALDRDAKGSDATLTALARVRMTQAGTAGAAGGDRPTVLDLNGIKVTHLSYTEVLGKPEPRNQPWRLAEARKERILADVAQARKLGAEWIAVSIHDSDELHYQPTPNQKSWDHWLTDVAKADLVVGTGSHVPEPVGERDGRFVLYGLGNLINWRLDARDSVIARVQIERQADGSVRTLTPELIPTFTEESRGYQVLDARKFHDRGLDTGTQADLREAFRRVDPYVDAWIPRLQQG